jgi:hypothetical protein
MQSSLNPMEVLLNIHLDLIKATETVSVPPPFNIQQHEVGTLMVCFLRYGLDRSHGFIAPRPLYTGPLYPHWNSFLPSSPEALRTHRCERPLLAREGN